MNAVPAQPATPEDEALAVWETELSRIVASHRAALDRARAAGTLDRARRTQIAGDHLFLVSAAGAVLMDATARGPYPPCRTQRGGSGDG